MMDSWMLHSKIDPRLLWTILLEAMEDRNIAHDWWIDCNVGESPDQLWSWLKQVLVKLIHEKEWLSFSLPQLQLGTESMGTAPHVSTLKAGTPVALDLKL
jgi:hypothetical protein